MSPRLLLPLIVIRRTIHLAASEKKPNEAMCGDWNMDGETDQLGVFPRDELEGYLLRSEQEACSSCLLKLKIDADSLRRRRKRLRRVPGLIEVVYGKLENLPKKNGGSGYAYRCQFKVSLGDLVLVPPNWFVNRPQVATVVSTYSDYKQEVSSVLDVVEKRKRS